MIATIIRKIYAWFHVDVSRTDHDMLMKKVKYSVYKFLEEFSIFLIFIITFRSPKVSSMQILDIKKYSTILHLSACIVSIAVYHLNESSLDKAILQKISILSSLAKVRHLSWPTFLATQVKTAAISYWSRSGKLSFHQSHFAKSWQVNCYCQLILLSRNLHRDS